MTTHPERTGHQATSRVGLNQRQAPGNPRAGGGPSGSYAAHTSFRTGDYPASAQSNAIAAETDREAQNKIFDAKWVRSEFKPAWESADETLELGDLKRYRD